MEFRRPPRRSMMTLGICLPIHPRLHSMHHLHLACPQLHPSHPMLAGLGISFRIHLQRQQTSLAEVRLPALPTCKHLPVASTFRNQLDAGISKEVLCSTPGHSPTTYKAIFRTDNHHNPAPLRAPTSSDLPYIYPCSYGGQSG